MTTPTIRNFDGDSYTPPVLNRYRGNPAWLNGPGGSYDQAGPYHISRAIAGPAGDPETTVDPTVPAPTTFRYEPETTPRAIDPKPAPGGLTVLVLFAVAAATFFTGLGWVLHAVLGVAR